MTHNEQRTHWFKEGAIGLGVGVLYGVTNVCVGHPFDTIKTKMQAQAGFEKCGMYQSFRKTLTTGGVVGLYRRVVIGGVIASTARAIIECPLEYAKISRQIGQTWTLRNVYTGFGVTWMRTVGLMTSYFIFLDSGRRNFNEYFQRPLLGPFLISGLAATVAWWIVWPLEYMKSQVQGHYGQNVSLLQRMQSVYRQKGGFTAMYRGLAPGSIRSFVANGTSMIVMSYAQRKVTELGLRD
ncbi:hypothetical protein HPB52_012961 [Rhipicephalus sanguineus]|uniref:Carnitine-acylcarnitine carrier protein n=1 Tax=Rhipicephalus sanguineus TaxID=34632 RepID=A0A9D4SMT6_RHISA|nr:hypothetical protein HPB52_012961 [Rhipicephalus sanguineus]